MKKFLFVCAVLVLVCLSGSAFGASKQELKRMSTFLSNFTELSMYYINVDTIAADELIHFGIWHNYVNNYRSRIEDGTKGRKVIDGEYVAESVKKFFDLKLKHRSTEEADYDGEYYHFMPADGETRYYAEVKSVIRKGKVITMKGELYNSEDKADRPGLFTAEAKPYKYKGEDRWALLTLSVEWGE